MAVVAELKGKLQGYGAADGSLCPGGLERAVKSTLSQASSLA